MLIDNAVFPGAQGAIYLKENRQEPPFIPPIIPAHPEQTERMVYLYVTDYLMNSGFAAAYDNGKLAINVTGSMVRKACRINAHMTGVYLKLSHNEV